MDLKLGPVLAGTFDLKPHRMPVKVGAGEEDVRYATALHPIPVHLSDERVGHTLE